MIPRARYFLALRHAYRRLTDGGEVGPGGDG